MQSHNRNNFLSSTSSSSSSSTTATIQNFSSSSSSAVSTSSEHIVDTDMLSRETAQAAIEGFVNTWYTNKTIEGHKQFYRLLLNNEFQAYITLDDSTNTSYLQQFKQKEAEESKCNLSTYEINRTWLHAIITPPESWSKTFAELLKTLAQYAAKQSQEDFYPRILDYQINYLLSIYASVTEKKAEREPKPPFEIILPNQVKTWHDWLEVSKYLNPSTSNVIDENQEDYALLTEYYLKNREHLVRLYDQNLTETIKKHEKNRSWGNDDWSLIEGCEALSFIGHVPYDEREYLFKNLSYNNLKTFLKQMGDHLVGTFIDDMQKGRLTLNAFAECLKLFIKRDATIFQKQVPQLIEFLSPSKKHLDVFLNTLGVNTFTGEIWSSEGVSFTQILQILPCDFYPTLFSTLTADEFEFLFRKVLLLDVLCKINDEQKIMTLLTALGAEFVDRRVSFAEFVNIKNQTVIDTLNVFMIDAYLTSSETKKAVLKGLDFEGLFGKKSSPQQALTELKQNLKNPDGLTNLDERYPSLKEGQLKRLYTQVQYGLSLKANNNPVVRFEPGAGGK